MDAAQVDEAYEICKLQASADGAFDEKLMRHWFTAAWELCAGMAGMMPPMRIEEPICIDPDRGTFTLSYQPTSDVEIYDGYRRVAVIPPSLILSRCTPSLCCLCSPVAKYWIGNETCEVSATFIQAVARVFAYIVENRGDSELDQSVLGKCGALAFLPDVTYVL